MAAEINRSVEAVIRHGRIEPIEALDLPEETRVQVTITSIQPVGKAEEEDADFYNSLFEAGLIDRFPNPNVVPSWKLHPPVEISGEPLSEIIIRSRDPDAEKS